MFQMNYNNAQYLLDMKQANACKQADNKKFIWCFQHVSMPPVVKQNKN